MGALARRRVALVARAFVAVVAIFVALTAETAVRVANRFAVTGAFQRAFVVDRAFILIVARRAGLFAWSRRTTLTDTVAHALFFAAVL